MFAMYLHTVRYKSEMSEYVQPEPVEGDGKKKGKKEKDPNAPKGNIICYICETICGCYNRLLCCSQLPYPLIFILD